jgi:hypothetical protein
MDRFRSPRQRGFADDFSVVECGRAPVRLVAKLGQLCAADAVMLLFGRGSMRRSLAEDVPADSEYGMIHAAMADILGVGRPDWAGPQFLEALAYGFWSTIHGMAMLQLTHLAGCGADFATAHRFLLESAALLWQSTDCTRAVGSAADRTRVL